MAAGFTLSDTPARGVTVSSRDRLNELLAVVILSTTSLAGEMVRRFVTRGAAGSTTEAIATAIRLRGLIAAAQSRTTLETESKRIRHTNGAILSRTYVTATPGGPRGVVVEVDSVTTAVGEHLRIRFTDGAISSVTTISDELRNLTYLTDEDSEYLTDEDGESFLILS